MKVTSIQHALLIVALITASRISAAQTQMYELSHLGFSGSIGGVHQPVAISPSGTVVGYNALTDAAFQWSAGNLAPLTSTRTLFTPSQATGISESGSFVAVGSSDGALVVTTSNGSSGPVGHFGFLSRAVNDSGLVVGQMPMNVNGNPETRAFSASVNPPTTPISLGTFGGNSVATAVNSSGQIVGYSLNTAGFTRAFFMKAGVMTDFEPGATTYDNWAYAINDIGTIVGASNRFICLSKFGRWNLRNRVRW